jgi:phosphinothricin acetyltransferase
MSIGADGGPFALRTAADRDLPAVQAIYAHHVLHGTASFETVPPGVDEMARRRADVVARSLPFLVAELGGEVLGYAYAAPYRQRVAYRFTLEDSVYVAAGATGRGLGRRLLERLLAETAALGYRQMLAIIGDSGNRASIALHERAGFRHVGTQRSVGFKFGRWLDCVLMQRALGPGDATRPEAVGEG